MIYNQITAVGRYRWASRLSLPSYTSNFKRINLPALTSGREIYGYYI